MKKNSLDTPPLSQLKRDPFATPQGYFEQLPLRVLQRLEPASHKPTQRHFLARKTTWIATAACVALAISFFALQPLKQNHKTFFTTEDSVQEYLLSRVESQVWMDAAAEYYLEHAEIITEENPQDILEEEIIDYLMYASF